jgi:hypothetical protein
MKTNTVDAMKLSPEEQAFLRVMIIRQHEKGKTPNEIMDILDLKPRLSIQHYASTDWAEKKLSR